MLIFDNLRGKYFCQIKNLDIEFSAHDALQELPSLGDAHNQKIGKRNNLKVFGSE